MQGNGAEQLIHRFGNLFTIKEQMPAVAAKLPPERRGPDCGKQQSAYLIGNTLLLKVTGISGNLNAEAKGADGLTIKVAEVGNDIFMGAGKVLGLLSGIF